MGNQQAGRSRSRSPTQQQGTPQARSASTCNSADGKQPSGDGGHASFLSTLVRSASGSGAAATASQGGRRQALLSGSFREKSHAPRSKLSMGRQLPPPKDTATRGLYASYSLDAETTAWAITSKILAPCTRGLPDEADGLEDCPICFMWYAGGLNRTACCRQNICTECYLQFEVQKLDGIGFQGGQCPFCNGKPFVAVHEGSVPLEVLKQQHEEQRAIEEKQRAVEERALREERRRAEKEEACRLAEERLRLEREDIIARVFLKAPPASADGRPSIERGADVNTSSSTMATRPRSLPIQPIGQSSATSCLDFPAPSHASESPSTVATPRDRSLPDPATDFEDQSLSPVASMDVPIVKRTPSFAVPGIDVIPPDDSKTPEPSPANEMRMAAAREAADAKPADAGEEAYTISHPPNGRPSGQHLAGIISLWVAHHEDGAGRRKRQQASRRTPRFENSSLADLMADPASLVGIMCG
ncbi:Protein sip5 [Diplonema papillatum]|nr:Protein sip5 [Diplonema papillatum]